MERRMAKKRLLYHIDKRITICEVMRQVYDEIHDYPDKELVAKITEKLVDMMVMTKHIATRFAYFTSKYHDKTGTEGTNLKPTSDYEFTKLMRRARQV
jgi:hypothetical protein